MVSRAFTPGSEVSEASRRRVLEIASSLGYVPNASAKALRLRRTFMVGAVFPTTYYGSYTRIIEAFEKGMSAAGYLSVSLTVGFDNSRICDSVMRLMQRGIEGLLMMGRIDDPELLKVLREKKTPIVTAYSALQNSPFPSVGIDNYAATRTVVQHLLELGHRRFAMVSGSSRGNDRQQQRQAAFRDALAEAGIPDAPIYEDAQGYTLQYATQNFRRLMADNPSITALVCNNDSSALASLFEAQRMGIDVPGRLSIAGFDDQESAALVNPGLTTVAVQAERMGEVAAELLLGKLEGGPLERTITLPHQLVVRGSTGRPPNCE